MYQSNLTAAKKRTNSKAKKRDFILPDDEQQYAVVKALLGNGRLTALCQDGVERLGKIRGSLRKGPNKAIINKNDLIIVSCRDYEDKVDVVHKYMHEEASSMFRMYEIPQALKKAYNSTIEDEIGTSETSNKTENFEFANSDDERDNVPMRRNHVEEITDADIDAL
jgi:translation initiation factor IF-1